MWRADTGYSGGNPVTVSNAIDRSAVPSPAPEAIYQSERWASGPLSYTFAGLMPSTTYMLRLHFAEVYYTSAGQRLMTISANNVVKLSNFDIFVTANGQNKAVVREISATSNASGTIVLTLNATSSGNDPKICGIELSGDVPQDNTPSNLTGQPASTYAILNWSAPMFPSGTVTGYNVYQGSTRLNASPITATTYRPGQDSAALTASTQYTFTIKTVVNGVETSASASTTLTTRASGGGTPGTYPSNVRWLSGCSSHSPQYANAVSFGTWRGQPVRYCTTWVEPYDDYMGGGGARYFLDGGYTGILNVSKHGTNGFSWQQLANGSLDGFINGFADGLVQLANASNMREIHANFGFELNGDWMRHSIIQGSRTGWAAVLPYVGAGWRRYANIMRAKAVNANKPIKITLNFSHQNAGDQSIQQIVNAIGTDYFDFLGLDHYDAWQPTPSRHLKTQSEWDFMLNHYMGDGSPDGYGSWFAYAESIGKPVTLPEWGLCDIRAEVTDNPFYIQKVNEFFNSKLPSDPGVPEPGRLYGESYFNLEAICKLDGSTAVPNSSATYNSLTWGG